MTQFVLVHYKIALNDLTLQITLSNMSQIFFRLRLYFSVKK